MIDKYNAPSNPNFLYLSSIAIIEFYHFEIKDLQLLTAHSIRCMPWLQELKFHLCIVWHHCRICGFFSVLIIIACICCMLFSLFRFRHTKMNLKHEATCPQLNEISFAACYRLSPCHLLFAACHIAACHHASCRLPPTELLPYLLLLAALPPCHFSPCQLSPAAL